MTEAPRKRFDGLTARTFGALVAASLAGWFGGALALDAIAGAAPQPRENDGYVEVALAALMLPGIGWLIFGLLLLSAGLAYGVLTALERRTLLWTGAAGAVVGVVFGWSVIEQFFNQGPSGAACGVPVGFACGMLFHRLRAR